MYLQKPTPATVTETIITPPVPEPVTFYGPTMLSVTPAGHYDANAVLLKCQTWIGGQGLAIDGRWGKLFSFEFYLAPTYDPAIDQDPWRRYKCCRALMEKHRDQILTLYGEEQTAVITQILSLAANGIMIPDTMTAEQIKGHLT